MPQEQTDKTITTANVKKRSDGKVRPFDTVEVRWLDSQFHAANTTEKIHPALAEKMVAKGIAEYVDASLNEGKPKVERKAATGKGKGGKKKDEEVKEPIDDEPIDL
jgi:hypothetical protein